MMDVPAGFRSWTIEDAEMYNSLRDRTILQLTKEQPGLGGAQVEEGE